MRIDKVNINGFKNLNNFYIDLDERKMHSVLIGENATGKSNFLEALVILFRDLDLYENKSSVKTNFFFDITYECKGNKIQIIGDPEGSTRYQFIVDKEKLSKKEFYLKKSEHLPKYVFAYYSGLSNRLEEHFDPHQRKFLDELLAGNNEPLRPLFYARLIHSHFVLMAFFPKQESETKEFLEEYLNIVGLESILFILKEPYWYNKSRKYSEGDERFWFSKGVVQSFLDKLYETSLAPIKHNDDIREDFVHTKNKELLYLYVSNQEKLEKLADYYGDNTNFFKMLESTYISDLVQEIRVKVKKKNVDGNITFKELSEGEQQLLTVLGLLRFTKAEESLFLLDEPDTHLNPIWKWKYIKLLEQIVHKPDSSQIILTTHDPLVIGGLTKEEIRIFYAEKLKDENNKEVEQLKVIQPDFDPKGLGVAGILTSDFFNLPSTLDEETLHDIIERNRLVTKQETKGLSPKEKQKLNELFEKLSALGINTTDRDPLYQKFIVALSQREEFQTEKTTPEDREQQNKIAFDILEELLKKEGNDIH